MCSEKVLWEAGRDGSSGRIVRCRKLRLLNTMQSTRYDSFLSNAYCPERLERQSDYGDVVLCFARMPRSASRQVGRLTSMTVSS
jgi:hypothetical protein